MDFQKIIFLQTLTRLLIATGVRLKDCEQKRENSRAIIAYLIHCTLAIIYNPQVCILFTHFLKFIYVS